MIYLVSDQQTLFGLEGIENISVEESLKLVDSWDVIQCDSETSGRDPHLCELLCFQFGDLEGEKQVVVDCATVNIERYKEILESHYLIFQNAKFDLQFLYNHNIVPRKIYDTMVVEQFMHLGYPSGTISYALDAIAYRYLGIYLDKSVRGEIIWRGLDKSVILYAANDVKYLGSIMKAQVKKLRSIPNSLIGAKIECDVIPAVAYMEWCGIKLDENKWKKKMEKDKESLKSSLKDLNDYCMTKDCLKQFVKCDSQLSLFEDVSLEPYFAIDWQKDEAKAVFKTLGFNINAVSKITGKESESLLEKNLSTQKGIDDKFLDLYFKYQEHYKVVTSFGQGHLNAINPKTGRLHTNFKTLGASSGRMSCGGGNNTELAKYKGLSEKSCPMVNLQQLPHDEITRSCFVAPEGYNFVSCDYSAQEGRVQGDIYQDEAILKMYREGIDGHSMYAKIFFKEELKDVDVHDVKKLRPDLRTKAKGPEFALAYGGSYTTIMSSLQCSEEEAKTIVRNYEEGFKGTVEFAKKGSQFVRNNGYIVICAATGHRTYWYNWKDWKEEEKSFTPEFWEEYRSKHKGTGDLVAMMVKNHFKEASKYGRLARNSPAQGVSAIMTKVAATNIFNWIVDKGYFGKVHCCVLVHDEVNYDYPKEVEEFPNTVKQCMEEAAAKFCKSLPIPAEVSVGDHWIH